MRNRYAVAALLVALLSVAVLVGAGVIARALPEVGYLEAAPALPLTVFLSFFALFLAGRGRDLYQRTLGRAGGDGIARFARGVGVFGLLLAATALLALGVFGLLVLTD